VTDDGGKAAAVGTEADDTVKYTNKLLQ